MKAEKAAPGPKGCFSEDMAGKPCQDLTYTCKTPSLLSPFPPLPLPPPSCLCLKCFFVHCGGVFFAFILTFRSIEFNIFLLMPEVFSRSYAFAPRACASLSFPWFQLWEKEPQGGWWGRLGSHRRRFIKKQLILRDERQKCRDRDFPWWRRGNKSN